MYCGEMLWEMLFFLSVIALIIVIYALYDDGYEGEIL